VNTPALDVGKWPVTLRWVCPCVVFWVTPSEQTISVAPPGAESQKKLVGTTWLTVYTPPSAGDTSVAVGPWMTV